MFFDCSRTEIENPKVLAPLTPLDKLNPNYQEEFLVNICLITKLITRHNDHINKYYYNTGIPYRETIILESIVVPKYHKDILKISWFNRFSRYNRFSYKNADNSAHPIFGFIGSEICIPRDVIFCNPNALQKNLPKLYLDNDLDTAITASSAVRNNLFSWVKDSVDSKIPSFIGGRSVKNVFDNTSIKVSDAIRCDTQEINLKYHKPYYETFIKVSFSNYIEDNLERGIKDDY